jgi:hypothetical protein
MHWGWWNNPGLVPERINYAIPIDEAKHLIRKAYPFGIEQLERRCRDCASPFAAAAFQSGRLVLCLLIGVNKERRRADNKGASSPGWNPGSLRYIATPMAIWRAEVVFVDELDRARPEVTPISALLSKLVRVLWGIAARTNFDNGFVPTANPDRDSIIVTRNSPLISAVSRERIRPKLVNYRPL